MSSKQSNNGIIISALVFGIVIVGYLLLTQKKENFRQVPQPSNPNQFSRPQMANPGFKAHIAPRYPILGENSAPILGQAPSGPMSAAPASPMMPSFPTQREGFAVPMQPRLENFAELGGSGAPVPAGVLTSNQVNQALANRVGSGTPAYQDTQDVLPIPDMKNSAGVDPTDPNSFMYDRTIFGKLKRRYGADVDYFRGDLAPKQESRGWFDTAPAASTDLATGYFNNYISVDQETAIRDANFQRNTSVEQLFQNSINPYGDMQKTPYYNV
jgi:hypothetical protein